MRSERKIALVMLTISVAAGFLANYYTKTDAELIEDYLKGVERALESCDFERCMALVHPRYHFDGVSAGELKRMGLGLMMRAPARDVIIVKRSIRVAGARATVYFSLIYLPKPEARLAYGVKSTWRIDLLKVESFRPVRRPCWLAIGIRPITMGQEPVRHLRDLKHCVVLR